MDVGRLGNLFTYRSACVGRRIRLLRLWPGSGTSQIRLFLKEVDLDSRDASFTAISYVWGDPGDTRMAACDGKVISITRSLHSALWQLREEGCKGHIWADAICINQSDTTEKTEQVRMMGDIYKKAELVFIWLGEATLSDFLGLGFMTQICVLLHEDVPESSTMTDLISLGLTNLDPMFWSSMMAIFQRPWFWRSWVVQEFHCARDTAFRCGQLRIPSNILFGVHARICKYQSLNGLIHALCGQAGRGADNIRPYGPFFEFTDVVVGAVTIISLLSRTRNLQSTDRRDRLFALVGLSSDASSSLIDYERDFDDVLRQITTEKFRNILGGSNPCAIFKYLCMVHKNDSMEGRTSWAPSHELPICFGGLGDIFNTTRCLNKTPHVTFRDLKFLQVNGRIIDQVKSILYDEVNSTPVAQFDPQNVAKTAEQYRAILNFQAKVSNLVHQRSAYPTGAHLNEIFWRSIIFDTEDVGRRATSSMAQDLASYQESLALLILLFEHLAGKSSEASPEDILKEFQRLVPQSKWRSSPNETDGQDRDLWAQIKSRADEKEAASNRFHKAFILFSWERNYFASQLGYLGWVPYHAREGDQICAFSGSRFPFVIRPCEEGFRLIGASYMQGLMEGEACELPNLEGDGDMMITLV